MSRHVAIETVLEQPDVPVKELVDGVGVVGAVWPNDILLKYFFFVLYHILCQISLKILDRAFGLHHVEKG